MRLSEKWSSYVRPAMSL